MFTLYMRMHAEEWLNPEDIQFIYRPTEAMELASIFYELDYTQYHQQSYPRTGIPERKHGVHNRYFSPAYKRRMLGHYDGLYDNVKEYIQLGWMIGIDTHTEWDYYSHPFSFDQDSNLVFDCFMDHDADLFEHAVRRIYEGSLDRHHGKKPLPTVRFRPSGEPVQHAQAAKTLNSKGVGRLLAAGGVYNGNVEGYRQTAEQLGGEAPAGYDQVMDNKGLLITGASIAAGLTMGRMRFPELDELEHFGARGAVSGRPFDPDLAGGPIENLTTEGVNITHDGIGIVERHISRFDPDPGNEFMVGRLKKVANGELIQEQVDLNYYTHECREYQRYCNLGWETGRPSDNIEAYDLWNNTHTATLEDYNLSGAVEDLYHPDAPSW